MLSRAKTMLYCWLSGRRVIVVAMLLSLTVHSAEAGEALAPLELGQQALSKGDWGEALIQFSKAAGIEPKQAVAYYGRAYTFTMKGSLDEAIADYTKVISLDPRCSNAYYGRGWVYARIGNVEQAIADYSKAISLDPSSTNAYCARGLAYSSERQTKKAIADFTLAIRLNPTLSEAFIGRGCAYAANRDMKKAIADLDEALKLRSGSAYYYEVRAAVWIRCGDYDRGIADLRNAIQLNPNDPAGRFEAWAKKPIDLAAIQRGEQQVYQMLQDRPAMGRFGKKAGVLYEWAARKFAGEDLRQEILWNASEPVFDAENLVPTRERPGCIRIRGTYRDGPDMGKERSFERMWRDAVCELYNITNAPDFRRTAQEAANGRLTREEFVVKIIEYESCAAEKTRSFYVHVFLPWAKEQRMPTDPGLWYVASRSDPREKLLVPHETKTRGTHWKYFESWYDSIRHDLPESRIESKELGKGVESR